MNTLLGLGLLGIGGYLVYKLAQKSGENNPAFDEGMVIHPFGLNDPRVIIEIDYREEDTLYYTTYYDQYWYNVAKVSSTGIVLESRWYPEEVLMKLLDDV